MRIRILKLVILFALAVICIDGESQNFDSWEKIKRDGQGTLSVIYFETPGIFIMDKGLPKGVCPELLNNFVTYVKTKYEKQITLNFIGTVKDFPSFLERVRSTPNLLGVGEVTITEDRKHEFKFTPPFLAMPIVLVTNKSNPSLSTLSDLKKYSPYTLASGSWSIIVDRLQKKFSPTNKVTYFNDIKEIVNKVDVTPSAYTAVSLGVFLDASRKGMNVKMESFNLGNPEMIAMAMSKSSDWDALWEEFLTEEYLRTSAYKKSIAKNLGSIFLDKTKFN
jgi:ABC-type amino acid transport substrate-binding protein